MDENKIRQIKEEMIAAGLDPQFVESYVASKIAGEGRKKSEVGTYASGIESDYYDFGSVPGDYRDEVTRALLERGYKPPVKEENLSDRDKEISLSLESLRNDISGYTELKDLTQIYGDTLDPFQIRAEYNKFHTGEGGEPWGPAKETGEEYRTYFQEPKTTKEDERVIRNDVNLLIMEYNRQKTMDSENLAKLKPEEIVTKESIENHIYRSGHEPSDFADLLKQIEEPKEKKGFLNMIKEALKSRLNI